jgi:hypothetical protein
MRQQQLKSRYRRERAQSRQKREQEARIAKLFQKPATEIRVLQKHLFIEETR